MCHLHWLFLTLAISSSSCSNKTLSGYNPYEGPYVTEPEVGYGVTSLPPSADFIAHHVTGNLFWYPWQLIFRMDWIREKQDAQLHGETSSAWLH